LPPQSCRMIAAGQVVNRDRRAIGPGPTWRDSAGRAGAPVSIARSHAQESMCLDLEGAGSGRRAGTCSWPAGLSACLPPQPAEGRTCWERC
jgi:hypothetical protein